MNDEVSKTIPDAIRPLLDDYKSLVGRYCPGLAEGFYLHGSIALGAFDERQSDIDFVAVLSRRATKEDVEALARAHSEVALKYPNLQMDGVYVQWSDLGCLSTEIEPYPYLHDGRLHESGYHETNLLTWWVLKNHGIAVIGPEPETLVFEVDWDLLIKNMMVNLNTYWLSWTRDPKRIATLLTDWGIQWAVLGISRLLYTFQQEDITSKVRAGEYALTQVSEQWHPLIREALAIRRGSSQSHYTSRIARAREALRFLKYMIELCNTSAEHGGL